jgi:OmpR family response regulator RpaB
LENNKKILVVDDEAHIRRVLEVKLKNKGYQILMAKNGQEGIDIINEYHPDIVITDINMPIIDGKTLCEKTNGLKKERSFLTIIITARINPEERDWISNMQDTRFFEKPFSPAKIAETIEQYLGGQG